MTVRDKMRSYKRLLRRHTMQRIDESGLKIFDKLSTAIGLLAALLLFFLFAPVIYADQICSDCHNTSTQHGGCNATCEACHGNPPVDQAGLVHNYLDVLQPLPTGAVSPGAHAIHASAIGSNYPCETCHYGGMPMTELVGNNKIQIGFNVLGAGGGSYGGGPLSSPYTYEGTNGTTIAYDGTMTCSGIYCHSDGTAVSTYVITEGSSPAWDAPGLLSCDTCHQYPPSYGQNQPKANSHPWHTSLGCNYCHYPTTADGTSITGRANHVNGIYNVSPDPGAFFNGNPVAFTYQYYRQGGQCSSISCHASKFWGGKDLTPVARFTTTKNGLSVNFVSFSTCPSGNCSFTWDFGDGTGASGPTVTHTYISADTYRVTLAVTDTINSISDTETVYVSVEPLNKAPLCNATPPVVSGRTVTFTDKSTDDSGAGYVAVNWGDGSAMTTGNMGSTFAHTYIWDSTYVITSSARDSLGLGCTMKQNATVNLSGGPIEYTIIVDATPGYTGNMTCYMKVGASTRYWKNGTGGQCIIPGVADGGTYDIYVYPSFPATAANPVVSNLTVSASQTISITVTP
jgi:predicted CxxxxCH...CXXCH cytochrome family protein